MHVYARLCSPKGPPLHEWISCRVYAEVAPKSRPSDDFAARPLCQRNNNAQPLCRDLESHLAKAAVLHSAEA